jgi:hypothetical protein
MSYIYDALKRAQTENERAATSPRIGRRRAMFLGRRSRWGLWLVIAGIAANVLVLTAVMIGQRQPVAPGSVAPEPTPEVRSPVAPVAPVAKDVHVPEPSPVAPVVPVAKNAPPPEPVIPPKPIPPVSAPRVPPATARVPARIERPVEERPVERRSPTIVPAPVVPAPPAEAVQPSAPVPAPTATLQVIVYSDVPAQRMVFIDGRRYREGDAFDPETVLERITADGVVMKRRGQRFVISNPRP